MYNIIVEDSTGLVKDYGREFLVKNDRITVLHDGQHVVSYSKDVSSDMSVHWIEDSLTDFVGNKYIFDADTHTCVLNPDFVDQEGL